MLHFTTVSGHSNSKTIIGYTSRNYQFQQFHTVTLQSDVSSMRNTDHRLELHEVHIDTQNLLESEHQLTLHHKHNSIAINNFFTSLFITTWVAQKRVWIYQYRVSNIGRY